jgi:hypothetical protein
LSEEAGWEGDELVRVSNDDEVVCIRYGWKFSGCFGGEAIEEMDCPEDDLGSVGVTAVEVGKVGMEMVADMVGRVGDDRRGGVDGNG